MEYREYREYREEREEWEEWEELEYREETGVRLKLEHSLLSLTLNNPIGSIIPNTPNTPNTPIPPIPPNYPNIPIHLILPSRAKPFRYHIAHEEPAVSIIMGLSIVYVQRLGRWVNNVFGSVQK